MGISVYSQGSGMYYCGRVREHNTPDKANVGISVYSQGSGMYYCGRVREHYTPDKAMWGFLCTVRAQVCTIVVE